MSSAKVENIVTDFKTLRDYEKKVVIQRLNDILIYKTYLKGNEEISCPFCGCKNHWRNGKLKERQRYLCKNCRKSYTSLTNTPIAHTKKDLELWQAFLQELLNQSSLRKIASKLGIALSTAFFWRHRILDAVRENTFSEVFSGIVEMDETYFNESFKGNHSKSSFKIPRKSRVRGKSVRLKGISHEKVCVVTAVNKDNNLDISTCCLGRPRSSDLTRVYKEKIEKNSTLVTDSHNSYKKLASLLDLNHIQIPKGKRSFNKFNIQKTNSLHSNIKGFIYKYKGVSTKYLQNYLVLFKFINENKEDSPLIYRGKSQIKNTNFKGRLPIYI